MGLRMKKCALLLALSLSALLHAEPMPPPAMLEHQQLPPTHSFAFPIITEMDASFWQQILSLSQPGEQLSVQKWDALQQDWVDLLQAPASGSVLWLQVSQPQSLENRSFYLGGVLPEQEQIRLFPGHNEFVLPSLQSRPVQNFGTWPSQAGLPLSGFVEQPWVLLEWGDPNPPPLYPGFLYQITLQDPEPLLLGAEPLRYSVEAPRISHVALINGLVAQLQVLPAVEQSSVELYRRNWEGEEQEDLNRGWSLVGRFALDAPGAALELFQVIPELQVGEKVLYQVGNPAKDVDDDGISDRMEELVTGTAPDNPDADGDALLDGAELAAGTDPHNGDSDADGMADGEEVQRGLNPLSPDHPDVGLTVFTPLR